MSVLNRAMFRIPGQDRISGIMRSSPNLIKVGTANASQITPTVAEAPEFRVGELNRIFPRQNLGVSNTEIDARDFTFGRVTPVNAESFGAIPGTSAITEEVTPESFSKNESGTFGKKINDKNKELLKTTKKDDSSDDPFFDSEEGDGTGEGEGRVTPVSEESPDKPVQSKFNFNDIKQRTDTEIKGIQNLYTEYSKDLADLNKANVLGKTMDQHKENFFAVLNKRPDEATFEDVRDSAFDMLGYDKKTLDENFTKDQQGSIWLNMMRAGLAMAAGESPNSITNVARGFQVGLEGYGKDMKDLTEDYREDVDKYQNTMYRLLKDKNSENIAKNALDVQREAAKFNIIQQTRGEERKDLLDKLNTEVAMRKLKIESMATMAKYNLEEFKLDKDSTQFQEMLEIHKAKIASMLPEEVNAAIADGLVQVIDDSKLITADNLELTQKGIDAQFSLVKSLKDGKNKYSITDKKTTRLIAGGLPGYGLSVTDGTEVTDSMKNDIGEIMMGFDKTYVKILDGGDTKGAFDSLMSGFNRLSKYGNKIKIDFQQLDGRIKKAYNEPGPDNKLRDQIDALVDKGIVINILE